MYEKLKQWYAKYDFVAGALKKKKLFLPLNLERVLSFSILKKASLTITVFPLKKSLKGWSKKKKKKS